MPMNQISRRGWLQTGALLAGAPCACLAQASNDCCTVPEAPVDGVQIQPGLITIHLDRTPDLSRTGGSVQIAVAAPKLPVRLAGSGRNPCSASPQKRPQRRGSLATAPTPT